MKRTIKLYLFRSYVGRGILWADEGDYKILRPNKTDPPILSNYDWPGRTRYKGYIFSIFLIVHPNIPLSVRNGVVWWKSPTDKNTNRKIY